MKAKNVICIMCMSGLFPIFANASTAPTPETNMEYDINKLQWTRQPQSYEISQDTIRITTAPNTDLWQRTYYHFRNDNAPVLQMTTDEQFFSFEVKTDFSDSHQRFDQCGIVLYLDSDNWLKGSVEYENERFQHLGSVVTNHGYSDWTTTENDSLCTLSSQLRQVNAKSPSYTSD